MLFYEGHVRGVFVLTSNLSVTFYGSKPELVFVIHDVIRLNGVSWIEHGIEERVDCIQVNQQMI